MGKRKKATRKPQGPKKREGLSTQFTCLFCNHEDSVSVKLDKKAGVGNLECKVCGQKFQCGINYLSAAIDVYSEWVDAADAVAKENPDDRFAGTTTRVSGGRPPPARQIDDDDLGGGYEGEGIVADEEEFD